MKKLWMMGLIALAGCQPDTPKVPAVPIAIAPVSASVATPTVAQTVLQTAPEAGKPVKAAHPEAVVVAEAAKAPVAPPAPVIESSKMTAPLPPVAPSTLQVLISEVDMMALAKKKNCFACHALDKKMVGPAWREIALKYRGDAGAQAFVENKISKGGKGVWGGVAMPAQPTLSAEELALLTRFILNLK